MLVAIGFSFTEYVLFLLTRYAIVSVHLCNPYMLSVVMLDGSFLSFLLLLYFLADNYICFVLKYNLSQR